MKITLLALRKVCFGLILTLAAPLMQAQSWTNFYSTGLGNATFGSAIALDSHANVIIAGSSHQLTGNNSGWIIIQYSPQGVPLWTNTYAGLQGSSTEQPNAVAVDTNNNIYVSGWSPLLSGSFGEQLVTIAYSDSGMPLWTNVFPQTNWKQGEQGAAMALDSNANVYVAGSVGAGIVTLAYSSAGTPLWTNVYQLSVSSDTAVVQGLVVGANTNVYVLASINEVIYVYTTLAYSIAGDPLWTNSYSSTGAAALVYKTAALTADKDGNACVIATTSVNGNQPLTATLKYSASGAPLWTNYFPGASTNIAADANGNVIALGWETVKYSSLGAPLWTNSLGASALSLDPAGNIYLGRQTPAVVALSSAGQALWTNLFGGYINALAADSGGDAFVTGGFSGDEMTAIKMEPPLFFLSSSGAFGETNGQFDSTLCGPGGSSVVLQSSADFQNWTPVQTNTLSGMLSHISAPLDSGARFYRAVLVQSH